MDKSTANMILNVEELKSWLLGPEQNKIAHSHHFYSTQS